MIYLWSVRHTGTRFLFDVLGLEYDVNHLHAFELYKAQGKSIRAISSHTSRQRSHDVVRYYKTVVPLRHPALVATSWKKYDEDGNWLKEWQKLDALTDVFFFPIEQLPYDALEEFVGFSVNRDVEIKVKRHTMGDYPEKKSIESAKDYLGSQWGSVEMALSSGVGKRFYQ